MNKTLDDFAKNLASGMSRRRAFWKFLAGAGGLGLLSGRRAKAGSGFPSNPANCGPFCLDVACVAYSHCLQDGGNFSECFFGVLTSTYQCCLSECQNHEAGSKHKSAGLSSMSGCTISGLKTTLD